jgi:transposase
MYYEKSKNGIYADRNQLEFICLEQLVPENHLLRLIENSIDFEFIHKLTKQYYSQDLGRPSLDTVTLFKIVLLNFGNKDAEKYCRRSFYDSDV